MKRGMARTEIFDRESFLKRIGGNEALCQELLGIFIERVPTQMQRLRGFLAQGDMERVKIEAHALKGMAVNLSANRFSGIAAAIEKAAGNGDVFDAPSMVADLESAFDEFMACL